VPKTGAEDALDILKKRYARGEINKEEFDQKKKDLTS
jgi:putative membrane protein